MASAMKRIMTYKEELEERSPGYKGRGVFFFNHDSTARPAVTRHVKRLGGSYNPLEAEKVLFLAIAPRWRPFSKSNGFKGLLETLTKSLGNTFERLQITFITAPYGVVPMELSETFPLSQFEIAEPIDRETLELTAELAASYYYKSGFPEVLLLVGEEDLDQVVQQRFVQLGEESKKGVHIISAKEPWKKETRGRIVAALKRILEV